MLELYVGIVHRTAAAVELVVWVYEVYPVQKTTRATIPSVIESLHHVHQRRKGLEEGEDR